ncbi:putative metalloprotease CJM1_0395 family protein [Undibacterium luofuense]|uniref:Catalase n=1 Tax=Undibacterium luofuense TaxID=2828733 RepID=A0A941DPA7_9BURK|nr:putative metalloprotease CJM1_0395 family protein [Undibacterium luofuense]MBR7783704.1 catalase [Undibacterium luofuense]
MFTPVTNTGRYQSDSIAAGTGRVTSGSGSSRASGAEPASTGTQSVQSGDAGNSSNGSASVQLSPEALALVRQLQTTDTHVRAHEMAHLVAASGLATGGPSFQYQRGPDGQNYAVGGEVGIDTSAGRTPQETLRRADVIAAAALAPSDPSGQDYAVAAKARQMAVEAQVAIQQEQAQKLSDAAKAYKDDKQTADASGNSGDQNNSDTTRIDTYA